MADPLILTFAEIEFLLRSQPDATGSAREQLDLGHGDGTDIAAKAGVSSLLARGLCTLNGDDVEPSREIVAIVAGLSTPTIRTRALGWIDERMVVVHLFDGPSAKLALFPAAYGQFSVQPLDPEKTTADQLIRFIDSCLASDGESAVLVQFVRDGEKVSIAVATDEAGVWYVSDSEDSPDRGVPTTRDGAMARIVELLDSERAAGVR